MNLEIVFATHNKHKLEEVRAILSPHGIVVYGLNDLNIPPLEINENGKTYFENALIKAQAVKKYTSFPIISDDSGLEITALNNAPGLYSARYATEKGGHAQAIKEILKNLLGKPREAYFVCAICLLNVEEKPLEFISRVKGSITASPEGESGFGYDPIFKEETTQTTYAKMSKDIKNRLSHRGKALYKLLTYLKINHLIAR